MIRHRWLTTRAALGLLAAVLLAGWFILSPGGVEEDYYESIRLRGAHVGWGHTVRQGVREGWRRLVRTDLELHISLPRDGQDSVQRSVMTCWETPDGRLVRFHSDQNGALVVDGHVEAGRLILTRTASGRTESESHPWNGWGGYFAPQDSLRREPMRTGEKRVIRSLSPITHLAVNTTLEAIGWENVKLANETQRLLKIEHSYPLRDRTVVTLMWADSLGTIWRSEVPGLGQELVRTSKADAMRPAEGRKFDLLRDTVVKLGQRVPDFDKVQHVVYLARLSSSTIEGVFATGASQRVRLLDEHSAQIEVVSLRPDSPLKTPSLDAAANADDLSPTTYLQSDDPAVRKIAEEAAAGETDPWLVAVALEGHVRQSIRTKGYSQAFLSAADVARQREGDCTEHAVLLAACLKARRIPARVAFGLVYVPTLSGFAYHMWTEAWIKDRWVPLDATQGRGGIGCDHIKLGDSQLQGGNANADILQVIAVFGQLELSVVEAE